MTAALPCVREGQAGSNSSVTGQYGMPYLLLFLFLITTTSRSNSTFSISLTQSVALPGVFSTLILDKWVLLPTHSSSWACWMIHQVADMQNTFLLTPSPSWRPQTPLKGELRENSPFLHTYTHFPAHHPSVNGICTLPNESQEQGDCCDPKNLYRSLWNSSHAENSWSWNTRFMLMPYENSEPFTAKHF